MTRERILQRRDAVKELTLNGVLQTHIAWMLGTCLETVRSDQRTLNIRPQPNWADRVSQLERVCAHCGELFSTPYHNALYCGPMCSGRAARLRWRTKYPDRWLAKQARLKTLPERRKRNPDRERKHSAKWRTRNRARFNAYHRKHQPKYQRRYRTIDYQIEALLRRADELASMATALSPGDHHNDN